MHEQAHTSQGILLHSGPLPFTATRASMVSDTDTPKIPCTWVVLRGVLDSYKILFYMVNFLVDCEKVFNFATATPW